MPLRTLIAVSNAGSPTMDHGLFIGGCLRYRSIAARIVRRHETLKSFPFSASLRHKKLSGSHLALLSSSLLSEFQTLFGLKTIL